MLTIENALLRVDIDENTAQLAHVIDKVGNFDYIWNGEQSLKLNMIQFPTIENIENYFPGKGDKTADQRIVETSEWTVVDKGDARLSLTLTQNESTLKFFPYEFSLMVTYSLTGNQLELEFLVKNPNTQSLPFGLGFMSFFNLPFVPDREDLFFDDYQLKFSPEGQELSLIEVNDLTTNKITSGDFPLVLEKLKAEPMIISNLGLTEVSLASPQSEHKIQLSLTEFPYLAITTLSNLEAPCLGFKLMNEIPDKQDKKQLVAPGEKVKLTTSMTFK
ncbi:aldose 1-epimerase family protein [Lactobacillus sp. PV034]|uniref:aldose epimerase family protein n=1 Tax=Lactobacillus sp. PV034 TaxID=2594495 RepID=UPI0022404512|nr:aldose 1-epimerase family protein [Lactobacillus sp. PV034]QNQ80988.1 aldose 1-epimerase family protein [Lactobacillus sp. PV034]